MTQSSLKKQKKSILRTLNPETFKARLMLPRRRRSTGCEAAADAAAAAPVKQASRPTAK